MVDYSTELSNQNYFYFLLDTKFKKNFLHAQVNSYIICIPYSVTLQDLTIDKDFLNLHLLKPSPYQKLEFIARHNSNSIHFKIQDGIVLNEKFNIRATILYEEIGYDEQFNEFLTIVIDRPLDPNYINSPDRENDPKISTINNFITHGETKWFSLTSHQSAKDWLDVNISNYSDHYTILVDYIDHAIAKLKEICEIAVLKSYSNNFTLHQLSNSDLNSVWCYVENYTLMKAYDKIFYNCCKKLKNKDQKIFTFNTTFPTISLADFDISSEFFYFKFTDAIERFSELSIFHTPFAKLKCIAETLDLITKESCKNDKDEQALYNFKKAPPITADHLIPLLAFVMMRSNACNLNANYFYLDSFSWHSISLPKLNYALVTFQASLEFIANQIELKCKSIRSNTDFGGDLLYLEKCNNFYKNPTINKPAQSRKGSLTLFEDPSCHPLSQDWRNGTLDKGEVREEKIYQCLTSGTFSQTNNKSPTVKKQAQPPQSFFARVKSPIDLFRRAPRQQTRETSNLTRNNLTRRGSPNLDTVISILNKDTNFDPICHP